MQSKSLIAAATAAVLSFAGCSAQVEGGAQPPAGAASNGTLTTAQRQHIRLFSVEPVKFHKTIEAMGVVDFDNDQATSVLAPFSGPVSRLLVSLGDRVKKGEPLAEVDSGDFASAIGAYQKALADARTDRRLADLDHELLEHNGVSQREADQAEADA